MIMILCVSGRDRLDFDTDSIMYLADFDIFGAGLVRDDLAGDLFDWDTPNFNLVNFILVRQTAADFTEIGFSLNPVLFGFFILLWWLRFSITATLSVLFYSITPHM